MWLHRSSYSASKVLSPNSPFDIDLEVRKAASPLAIARRSFTP